MKTLFARYRRYLAVLMASLLVLSCFQQPGLVPVRADEASTETVYSLVASLEEVTSGKYVIVGKYSDTIRALKGTVTKNNGVAEEITVTDDKITDPASDIIWTVDVQSDGTFTFFSEGSSKYLGLNDSNSKTSILKLDDKAYSFTGTNGSESAFYYFKAVPGSAAENRAIAFGGSDFRAYAVSNAAYLGVQLYKLDETPVTPDPVDPDPVDPDPVDPDPVDPDPVDPDPVDPDPVIPSTITVAEALDAEEGALCEVEGVVTYASGKSAYIQDSTGVICLYFDENKTIEAGTVLHGQGIRSTYINANKANAETHQLKNATAEVVSTGNAITPNERTLAEIAAKPFWFNDEVVNVNSVTLKSINASGNSIVADGGTEMVLYNAGTLLDGLKEGDVISITSAQVYVFYDSKQKANIPELKVFKDTTGITAEVVPDTSIAAAIAAENGTECEVEGVVTYASGKNVYVQDATGVICLYFSAATTYKIGDRVHVKGTRSVYNSINQLTVTAGTDTLVSQNNEVQAITRTLAELVASPYTYHEEVANIEKVTLKSINKTGNSIVTDGTNEVILYKAGDALGDIAEGSVITLTNAMIYNYYNKNAGTSTLEITMFTNGDTKTVITAAGSQPVELPKDVITAKVLESVADGDKILLYSKSGKAILTSSEKEYVKNGVTTIQLLGAAAEFDSNIATLKRTDDNADLYDKVILLTVNKVSDTEYTFTSEDGKYFTSAEAGNGVSLTAEANDCSKWTLEAVEGEAGFYYIKNVGAAYNGNHNQSLEIYSGAFTTYSHKTTDYYKFAFLGLTEAPTPVDPPVEIEGTAYTAKWVKSITDGAKVSLFSKAGNEIMTLTADGKKLKGVSATTAGEDLTIVKTDENADLVDSIAAITVHISNGVVTFTDAEGKFLTSEPTGNGIKFEKEANEYSYWTLEETAANSGYYYVRNNAAAYYKTADTSEDAQNNVPNQSLEYYSGFTTYTNKTTDYYHFAFYTVPEKSDTPIVVKNLTSGTYVLYSKSASGVMGYPGDKTVVASTFDENGNIKLENAEGAAIITVEKQSDGTYILKMGKKYLTAESNRVLSLKDEKTNDTKSDAYWNIEFNASLGGFTIASTKCTIYANSLGYAAPQMFEYYASNGFCLYYPPATSNIYAFDFYPVDAAVLDVNGDGYAMGNAPVAGNLPVAGKSYVISCDSQQHAIGMADNNGTAPFMRSVDAVVEDGKLNAKNGALIFNVTIDKDGYYLFENGGKYLATNTDETLFLVDDPKPVNGKNADGKSIVVSSGRWYLTEAAGGYIIYNADAKYSSSPVCIEYYSGAFSGWTYKGTSIFLFNFYEATDEYGTGYVVNPEVVFEKEITANYEVDQPVSFTLDDLGEVINLTVEIEFKGNAVTFLGDYSDFVTKDDNGKYTLTIPYYDFASAKNFTVTVTVTSDQNPKSTTDAMARYSKSLKVEIADEPVIVMVNPKSNAETGSDKQPVISFNYANIGEGATAVMTVDGTEVPLTQDTESRTFSWTSPVEMEDGKKVVAVTVTRADGKVATKTWSFVVGNSAVKPYFGMIHSHTAEYSDGTGTLEEAFEYSMDKKRYNVDYMIVTDHSNYFDTTSSATKESIYDPNAASLDRAPSDPSISKWIEAKNTAAYYDSLSTDFVAGYGYEMTWSGGPGHINVFNSLGIVSRNNDELNNKANNAGMLAFYDLLVDANKKGITYTGEGTISAMFNHPGTTFGFFDSFTGLTPERDEVMNLIEVGNGDGYVGGNGYWPSYEYYDMALTVGWHIAPANNQDNHKGAWGDSNTCRTVTLTDNFTEQGIYDAMSSKHLYSTEDNNLSMIYYLGETLQGGVIENYDEENVHINVTLSDEDNEALGYVYVIGENGKILYTSDKITTNTAELDIELKNTSAYYYIKVAQADGDIAVSAPVWVGDMTDKNNALVVSLDNLETAPEEGRNTTFTFYVANKSVAEVTNAKYSLSIDGTAVVKDISLGRITADSDAKITYTWNPEKGGSHSIVMAVTAMVDGETRSTTLTKNIYVKGKDYDTVSTVSAAKAGEEKQEFTVEGYLTANTSGYDKDSAFFDCTYLQDSTGGINIFPVAGNFRAGQKVRVHGAITYYNGEIELNLSEDYGGYIEIIDESINEVAPAAVSCADAMDPANVGLLMQISGKVTRINESSGSIDRIYVTDESGTACIYINGYILNSTDKSGKFGPSAMDVKIGDSVTAIGIGSIDVDELGEVDFLHRLRTRDRAEIVVNSAVEEENGFVEIEGAIYYLVNGEKVFGWQNIEGSWYYFIPDTGVMNTSKKTIDGIRYKFNSDGTHTEGTIYNHKYGVRYYFAGKLQTGFIELDGNTYYFDPDNKGFMAVDGYVVLGNETYFFDENGLLTGKKVVTENGIEEYDANGNLIGTEALEGFKVVGGQTYYYENGDVVYGWKNIEGSWYYFLPNTGIMNTKKKAIDGVQYKFNDDGTHTEPTLYNHRNGVRYYFAGEFKTGFIEIEGNTYYFDPDNKGFMAVDGFRVVGNETYYFDENGIYTGKKVVTENSIDEYDAAGNPVSSEILDGFKVIGDKTYYYEDGEIVSGWKNIEGSWYYFLPDTGVMNTAKKTIDGIKYQFNADGTHTDGTVFYHKYGVRYYFAGKMQTGFIELDGNTYYFNAANKGFMVVGTVFSVEGVTYVADENGIVSEYEEP